MRVLAAADDLDRTAAKKSNDEGLIGPEKADPQRDDGTSDQPSDSADQAAVTDDAGSDQPYIDPSQRT